MLGAEYPDIPYDGPPRSYGTTSYGKSYVAVHNTSNDASDTAEADYAQRRTDGTSSHYYADADSITQSLNTAYGANHAGSSMGNRYAVSYEITGANGWTREQWMARVAWPLVARQMARDCRKWSVPARLLTVAEMRAGNIKGFVTHDLMRQAWGGTTHTDPGPGFPMDYLLQLVQRELTGPGHIEDGHMFLSSDPVTGKIYASDDQLKDRWEVAANDRASVITGDLPYLAALGVVKLWNTAPRAEVRTYTFSGVSFAIWRTTGDVFGKLAQPAATVDVPALAAALAPAVRGAITDALAAGGVPSVADIESAMSRTLNGTTLVR